MYRREWSRSQSRSQDDRWRPFQCIVENGDDEALASYGAVAGNLVNLQTLDGHGDVVCGDVEGGGFGGVVVEDVLC